MECREAFFAIQRHYDGELSTEEQHMLDHHLLTCADCQQEFDEYGDLFGDINCLAIEVEHRDVLSHTLERIEEATRKRRMDIWWRIGAVAASFAVITSTAFFSLTETGSAVGSQVARIFQDSAVDSALLNQPIEAGKQPELVKTTVTDDPQAAVLALHSIRQQVSFPLLELKDERLTLVSTELYEDQMVDLTYKVQGSSGANADMIYFLAATDHGLIKNSQNNLGVYDFSGSVMAGEFIWSKVGEHAITAEINNVIYQIYSPFLSTGDLIGYAATLRKVNEGQAGK